MTGLGMWILIMLWLTHGHPSTAILGTYYTKAACETDRASWMSTADREHEFYFCGRRK